MARDRVTGIEAYLAAAHAATGFRGVQEFHRRYAQHLGHERTLARWRRRLRPSLRVFPSFTVEALGLSHVHLVILDPDDRWLRWPYAVEHAWTTPNLVRPSLYLHCIVPTEHLAVVEDLVLELGDRGLGRGIIVLRSGSGWQHLHQCGHHKTIEQVEDAPARSVLVREHPLVVPVVACAWNHDVSLPGLWASIRDHLGPGVREYLPRQHVLRTNGKQHVRDACRELAAAGLFRQQIIRYTDNHAEHVEVLLLDKRVNDRVVELLEELHELAQASETYPARGGGVLERIVGSARLLDAIIRTAGTLGHATILLVDRREDPGAVRFCYELLFNPKTGAWNFPREEILRRMTASR